MHLFYNSVAKKVFLLLCLTFVSIFSQHEAVAVSIGMGGLNIDIKISQTANTLQWGTSLTSLETWNSGFIAESGISPYHVMQDSQTYQNDTVVPGWDQQTLPLSGSYLNNNFSIISDHTNPLTPSGQITTTFSSSAFLNSAYVDVAASVNFFGDFYAIDDGFLELQVNYDGYLAGTTSSINDWLLLSGKVRARVDSVNYDLDGNYTSWGSTLLEEEAKATVNLSNIDSGSIDDFVGSLSLLVEYTKGDYFHIRLDGSNEILGHSDEQVSPVPEPATFLLLGSGLAGLAFYRRKRK